MKRPNLTLLAACLMASLGAAGCTSTAPIIRGQNPDLVPNAGVTQTHGHRPVKAAIDEVTDCYHEHHNTTTTFHNGNVGQYAPARIGGAGHLGHGGCPQSCPPGYGNCPPGYQCPPQQCRGNCPQGACRCGNDLNWYPKHGYSYSYKRPNDLVYPQQGAVGGAVVYPYYTHKGPSDFFRKE